MTDTPKHIQVVARALAIAEGYNPDCKATDCGLALHRVDYADDAAWTFFVKEATDIDAALLAAGYVVVPRKPTEAMVEAGLKADEDEWYFGNVYRAMIEAGQKP